MLTKRHTAILLGAALVAGAAIVLTLSSASAGPGGLANRMFMPLVVVPETATPTSTPTGEPPTAPPLQTPTATATTPPANCDASYPTVCIPTPPPDLDCGGKLS